MSTFNTPTEPTKLIPIELVCQSIGLCRSRVYERMESGDFPKPVKVGRSSRWVSTEVDAWIATRIAARNAAAAA